MKKGETTKSTTAKTAAAETKKRSVGRPAGRKPAAEKEVKETGTKKGKAPKVVLQYGEISVDYETLVKNAANYLEHDKNISPADQVGVEIYLKPEDGKAYIVSNGEEEGYILL